MCHIRLDSTPGKPLWEVAAPLTTDDNIGHRFIGLTYTPEPRLEALPHVQQDLDLSASDGEGNIVLTDIVAVYPYMRGRSIVATVALERKRRAVDMLEG